MISLSLIYCLIDQKQMLRIKILIMVNKSDCRCQHRIDYRLCLKIENLYWSLLIEKLPNYIHLRPIPIKTKLSFVCKELFNQKYLLLDALLDSHWRTAVSLSSVSNATKFPPNNHLKFDNYFELFVQLNRSSKEI